TTANSTRYWWISANRICGRWNIASPNTFLVSPGPYHGVVGVVGVVVSHGLVNEVDSEEPTRRGVVHHISVCRLNKQARGGIGWERRSGPGGNPRWSVVSQQADFAADTKNLFKQPLLVAGVLAFHAKPYGIVSRAPLLSVAQQGITDVVISPGVIRFVFDRSPESLQRARQVALRQQDVAEIEVSPRRIRCQPD